MARTGANRQVLGGAVEESAVDSGGLWMIGSLGPVRCSTIGSERGTQVLVSQAMDRSTMGRRRRHVGERLPLSG